MFTGIVEEVGKVKALAGHRLSIGAKRVLEGTRVGDSININGACLTITELDGGSFSVEVMPETQRRTNLGQLHPGSPVNLERALSWGARVGGHLVQGHGDATGRVLSLTREEGSVILRVSAPSELLKYIVVKGFIAVEGVSLTVVEVGSWGFSVSLVAYTLENTNLGAKQPGDPVNLEVDILGKYVEKLLGKQGLTLEFLAQQGFI